MILIAAKEGTLKIKEDKDEVSFSGMFTVKGNPIIVGNRQNKRRING